MRRLRVLGIAVAALLLAGCAATGTIPAGTAPMITATADAVRVSAAAVPSRAAASPAVRASAPPAHSGPPSTAARAAAIVSRMSPDQLAGSVLMTAGTVSQLRGLAGDVRRYHLSGLMVRGRSAAGAHAVRDAFGPAQAAAPAGLPLLTATDQEGGLVQVLSGPGFATIPSAVQQGRSTPSTLRRDAASWGRSLRAAGVRLDLAPVADVPCAADLHHNPPIADLDRQYGSDPAAAGRHVAAFVQGMRDAGVQTTVKHFPGLGCVRANTDTTAGVVDSTTTATSPRLASFRAGIDAGAGFLMVSSASYARIDRGVPALFSKRVIALARSSGFRGVVMSDDVGAAVALRSVRPADRATRFIGAGGDLLLDVVPADVPAEARALVAAQSSPAFRTLLRGAAARVVAARLSVAGH